MRSPQSETTTLVFAVAVAVALGVACGVWVNAKLTAAASEHLQPPARLAPAATPERTAPGGDSQSVSADSQQQAADGDSHQPASENGAETSANGSDAPSESQAESQTERSSSSATDAGRKDRPATAAVISATRDARTHVERETSSSEKARAREDEDAEPKAGRGSGSAAPCAVYTSTDSLTLRVGGAASLVVVSRGEAARVNASTPAWADIAVFSEGPAGNGWVRYSVRSVSKRPGVYTVHFKTPCGSQSVSVMVTRP
ncbi:MAG TPA: hypothetical protein VJ866_24740 [Pyrinomonadaceae bacterium]|nr:hypothetical protein [Pyrinomonadaceae bacterium]